MLRHRLLDVGRQLLGLAAGAGVVPLLEVGHDAVGEQLERRADVLVAVVAALLDEDHLVDADVLERLEIVARTSSGLPMPPVGSGGNGGACLKSSQMLVRAGTCVPVM